MTVLSILTAVVCENMLTNAGEQHMAMKLQRDEEELRLHTLKLSELFASIDDDSGCFLEQSEIDKSLSNHEGRIQASKDTGIPIHCVRECLALSRVQRMMAQYARSTLSSTSSTLQKMPQRNQ